MSQQLQAKSIQFRKLAKCLNLGKCQIANAFIEPREGFQISELRTDYGQSGKVFPECPQSPVFGKFANEGLAIWFDSNFQSMERCDPAWKAGRFGKHEPSQP
jgi:hypothetical protein